MNEYELFDAFNGIDDELLERSERMPVRKLPIRRALIAAAAVVVLVFSVCAHNWSHSAAGLVKTYDEENHGYIWSKNGTHYMVEDNSFYTHGREIRYVHGHVFTSESLDYYVECPDETLQATLEAMILMEDGRMEYKKCELTDSDSISLAMDNHVGDEAGTIISVRNRLLYKMDGGWEIVHERYSYLPSHIGFQVPYGIDPRFPDMQYNYDGRVPAA